MLKRSIAAACAVAALGLSPAAFADTSEKLEEDTVLCMKNTSSEDAVAVVYENLRGRRANAREVRLAPGKTSCLRYRDAREVKADFFFASEADQFTLRPFRGVCKRVKANFAKYYELGRSDNGRRTCQSADDMSSDQIRGMVRSAKAINS